MEDYFGAAYVGIRGAILIHKLKVNDKMDAVEFYDDFISYQIKIGINERIYEVYRKIIDDGLHTEMNILEIGCGIGSLTYLLEKKIKKGKIESIDLSPKSIEFAKSKLRKSNVYFSSGNVLDFMPKYVPYDKIVLADVLEHIPQEAHLTLFEKLSTWLKNDGSILINIPNPNSILYDQKHRPESLQVIDQPIFIDKLVEIFSKTSLELVFFETYSIWVKNDYNFMIVKKKTEFKEIFLSEERDVTGKILTRLKREIRRIIYSYPGKLNSIYRMKYCS